MDSKRKIQVAVSSAKDTTPVTTACCASQQGIDMAPGDSAGVSAPAASRCVPSTWRRRPNLLLIWTDEQRRDTLNCYGNNWLSVSNLNRLAENSFVFDRAYVTQPVCTASRSTVMTGLYPHTNGCIANNIPLRRETKTIAEMVSGEYACGYIGKWHLGDEINAQHGFEHWVSIEDLYRDWYSNPADRQRSSNYHDFLVAHGVEPDGKHSDGKQFFSREFAARQREELCKAAFCTNEAERFVRANKDRPFLLSVNFFEPHMPFTGPLNDLYDPASLPTAPHFLQPPPANASWRNRLMASWFQQASALEGSELGNEQNWRRVRAYYHGLVTQVDNAIGRILRTLAECGLTENTIVVFTSDHGDMMGDHHLLAKCVQYEEAVSVPCLIHVPWMAGRTRRIGGAFGQVDLVPTLLELMGQPVPAGLDGVSRMREMSDGLNLNDAVFIEWNGNDGTYMPSDTSEALAQRVRNQPWRTIIHGGWKLNLSPADQCELYDLQHDPREQTNRYDDPTERGRVRELTMMLREWQERTHDDVRRPGE